MYERLLAIECCFCFALFFAAALVFVCIHSRSLQKECTPANAQKSIMYYILIGVLLYMYYSLLWSQMLDFIPLISGEWSLSSVEILQIDDTTPPYSVQVIFNGKKLWLTVLDEWGPSFQEEGRISLYVLPALKYAFQPKNENCIPALFSDWRTSVMIESILCVIFSCAAAVAAKRSNHAAKFPRARARLLVGELCCAALCLVCVMIIAAQSYESVPWLRYWVFLLRFLQTLLCLIYVFIVGKADDRNRITVSSVFGLSTGGARRPDAPVSGGA